MTVILEMPLQETSTLDGSVVPVALPLNGSSTLPWSAQIARARELFKVGQEHSQAELARTLLRAYNHGYESSSLLEAVVLFRNMHNLAPGDALLQSTLDLGSALFAVHRLTGHLEPIEEMVNLHESVAASTLHSTGLSSQYAKALLARGAFTGSQTDISEAKKIIDNAWLLDSTPSPDLLVASAMYHHLQIRVSDQYDLEELRQLCNNLITELTRGRNLSVTGLPVRADVLAFTFVICNIICEVTGTLGRAVEVVRLVDSMGEFSRSLPDHVQILCSRSLFYITLSIYDASNTTHTAMAREWIERSFHVTEHNAIDRSQVHSALGCWLLIRRICLQKGEADDSKVAAEEYRKALDLCPRGHIYRFRYLVGLTASLSQHFVDTGSIASLNEGATLTDDCLEIAGRIPSLAVNISELLSLRARVGRLSRVAREALLQRAIKLLQTALDGTPETNNARTGLFSLLSRVYALQDSLGFEVDRSEHLAAARRDLAAHVDEAHQKVRAELNVTYALLRVAHEREDADILREGMELLEHVMDELTGSINDDSLSADAASLKVCYHLVYYHLYGTDADLAAAEKLYDPRVGVVSGGHTIRCLARSMNLARFARLAGQPSLEMRAYHHDIDMLPRLAYVGGDVTTRVAALQLVEGLASRAATLALTMNNAPNAIELLEQTRGIEWSQSLQLRVSSDAAPPQHAEVFTQVAASLQTAKDPVKRREYAGEWETIIKRIRQVEGYERFLLPGSYSDLKACASQGAVVIVIPSDGFVDVVTIPSPMSDPAHLRLPELKLARFQELTVRLKRTSDSSRDWESLKTRGMKKVGVVPARTSEAALEAEYFEALRELWSKLVLPVINSLQISRAPAHMLPNRPRLWWCPVGPFAKLPLHAAGVYRGPSQDCLANYVVSSYTPTLSALITARSTATQDADPNILLISVPKASGFAPLPNAEVEVDRIRGVIDSADLMTVSDSEASIANVLGALPAVSVLHLACHGHQSQDDPLTSGFSLHDGRLTLERLMQLQLPRAELAYLSACETASTDEYQPDEAINLAATMLFVGFKSVIATMWSMNDLDGPFIAQRVYRTIFRNGKLDLDSVPYALDAAVRELRESGAHPSRWATYVHIGA